MKTISKTVFLSLLLCIFFSCGNRTGYQLYLERAQNLLEEYPDSALKYLDSIPSPELLKEKDEHTFYLLQIQAKDKTGQSITNDTIIWHLNGLYDKNDPRKASLLYLYSGKIYESNKKYQEALVNYLNAEKYSEKLTVKYRGLIHHSIGNLFFIQRNTVEAKTRLKKSLTYYEDARDMNNIITIYNLVGNCYILENQKDSAYIYYDKCVRLLDQSNNHLHITAILSNLSQGYLRAGDTDKAVYYLEKALTYPVKDIQKARINYSLAKINIDNKESFYNYMEEALVLSKEETDTHFKTALFYTLYEYENNLSNYQKALEHYSNYTISLKEFYDDRYENSLADLQHSYHVNSLIKDNMNLIIRNQKMFIVISIVTILLLLSIGYIYKQRKELEDAKKNLDYLHTMASNYNEKEKTLKNIVLKNFDILKKVACLEQYVISNPTSNKLIRKFNEIVYKQDCMDWEQLYETMNSVHNDLFTKLKIHFPQLDEVEFRICCLTVAKFSNIEMGVIMKYSPNTIQSKKAIIRRKLGVKSMGNIRDFLYEYFDEKQDT